MNVFDPEFYPTPKDVIEKMLRPYVDILPTATILEPSAGSGAILDFITETGLEKTYVNKRGESFTMMVTAQPEKVRACEHNPELQMILQGKGYRLVAEDFLTYVPDVRFNLVVMNPPFKTGARHLLHAWDILQGGDIVCLLNAETVRNPCTAERERLAAIIRENGSVEYIGEAFRDADNPTDVDVAIVRLHKEAAEDPFKIDIDGFVKETMPDFGSMASGDGALAQSNRLDAFIRSWELAKAAAVNYLKARKMLGLYLSAFLKADQRAGTRVNTDVVDVLEKHLHDNKGISMENAYNYFVEEGKREAWDMIFSELNISKYMTSSLREKFNDFRHNQSSMAITKENVMKFFEYIMLNLGTIMDNSVSEVYDLFTSYFKGNTSCEEGWKTNKRYQCNRKVILPDCVSTGFMPQKYGYNTFFSPSYRSSRLDDIDKAMCWLSGRNFDSLTGEMEVPGFGPAPSPQNSTITQAIYRIRVGDQDWHESAFFRIKAFKKGTVHLEFKDEALWTRFNQTVNKEKNLVGAGEDA